MTKKKKKVKLISEFECALKRKTPFDLKHVIGTQFLYMQDRFYSKKLQKSGEVVLVSIYLTQVLTLIRLNEINASSKVTH